MSAFVFLNPWLLLGLAALPVLWVLLRVMPPAPQKVFLPSARFLVGLMPNEQTPSKTPWWILLMRVLAAALVILALAQPVLNPSNAIKGDEAIRIVIDNGWSSAHVWDDKIKTAEDFLAQASRQNMSVYLNTTAPEAGSDAPLSLGPLSASEALSRLKGLSPHPWPVAYNKVRQNIKNTPEDMDSIILSDGIKHQNMSALFKTLSTKGDVAVYTPANEDLPVIISCEKDQGGDPNFVIHTAKAMPAGVPLALHAMGNNGRILGVESFITEGDTTKTDVVIQLPSTLKRDLTQVRIQQQRGAGSLYVFGNQFQKKRVGIVSPSQDSAAKPFIEASFYLTRALDPYAELQTGTIDTLLNANVSMMILPDIGALPPIQLDRLEDWVRDGGLLLRFAGTSMSEARGQQFLVPTPLRSGKRSLDGALAWETPPKLDDFAENSPLSGIKIREDVTVQQQILAEPAADLPSKIWASLDDGTPLITADSFDDGLIVMVHTTASPDWSNLPLSGVYVQVLRRLVGIAGSAPDSLLDITNALEPLRVMDGYGRLIEPDSNVQIIAAQDFASTKPSSKTPPGIYGQSGLKDTAQDALNLGDHITSISAILDSEMGRGITRQVYGAQYERSLMPPILAAALCLLLLDWIVMIALSSQFKMRRLSNVTSSVAFAMFVFGAALCLASPKSMAQVPDEFKYAEGLYLGFMKSKNAGVNAQARAGLTALSEALTRRTSAEPDGVVALDPETDILAFFPLIYWPVDAADGVLSEDATRNVQAYLDNGGTILFDTREASISSDPSRGGANARALAAMTEGLNIPALSPAPDDHVLTKSFYLLDRFPGRYRGGTLWVEGNSENGRDGVSRVLIGNHDWANAWAAYGAQNSRGRYASGGRSRERELAIRFGINLTMYALTGNYKADQVHVKHILERLDQ